MIGGIAGYAIGYYLFEYIGEPILKLYGYGQKYEDAADLFNAWGPWILIAKGWTPFPYKVLTIAAGAFKMSLVPFILASIVARAMRFYLVAALLYWFGEPIRDFIERRLSLVTTAFVVALVGGFVAIKVCLLRRFLGAMLLRHLTPTRCDRRPTAWARSCCSRRWP